MEQGHFDVAICHSPILFQSVYCHKPASPNLIKSLWSKMSPAHTQDQIHNLHFANNPL